MKEQEEKAKSEEKEQNKEEELVSLTKEQYDALLERVSELEGSKEEEGKKDTYTLDELAEEGKKTKRTGRRVDQQIEDLDWDNMSNKEIFGKLVDAVNAAGRELQTEIETLKVMREIDKAEVKYKDFWKFEKDVRRIAMENPSLSIEKAYKLAKVEKGESEETEKEEKGEKEDKVMKTKTEKLLNLPPRGAPIGEKPGVASTSTKASEIKTLREATSRAWDEVVGKGKSVI